MADTFSTNLALRLIATGSNNNTWGGVLNADALSLIDSAFGESVIDLGSSTTRSLATLVPGAASESRSFALLIQGVPASAVTITVPASVVKKFYLVDNQCGQTITFTYAGSTSTVTILTGSRVLVWCDGTNTFQVQTQASDSASLGGVAAINYARRDTANTFASTTTLIGAENSPLITLTDSPSIGINASLGNNFFVQIAANRAIANPGSPSDGQLINLFIEQDAVGGRTVTFGNQFIFAGGSAPTLSTFPNHTNRIVALYIGSLNLWLAADGGDYNTSGTPDPVVTAPITISQNTKNVRLIDILGTGLGATTVNVVVKKGVVISSDSILIPCLDCSGFDSGATVNLTIEDNVYFQGKGGDGANGCAREDNGGAVVITASGSYDGTDGGHAIRGVGIGVTFNITNNGFIWGGGGGGGGGGGSYPSAASTTNGGGGGGGAGGGKYGLGGRCAQSAAAAHNGGNGIEGSVGSTGTFGTGGAGNGSNSAPSSGGDGGDWGTAGTAGGTNTTFGTGANQIVGGLGGAAGKAIDLFSGTVNFISGGTFPHVKGSIA